MEKSSVGNRLSLVNQFLINRREKKELQQLQQFMDLVYYAREIQAWPQDYKDRYWKERMFYRKLIKAIPELIEFETGREEPRHRITHNEKILIIIAEKCPFEDEELVV